MIAFSCVHCGERMQVTEDSDGKRARCLKCGQVVLIPKESGLRGLRRLRAGTNARSTTERPPVHAMSVPTPPPTTATPPPGELSDSGSGSGVKPPLYELPTRLEATGPAASGAEEDQAEEAARAELTGILAPPQAPDEIGRLGPYRVLEVLGSGGMGVVFKAEDPSLERLVALKAVLPGLAASATTKQRFLREAKTAAKITHDRIVPIYHVDEDRGVPFIAMPLLEGETLDARLRRGALPLEEVLRITREVAEGLAVIHEKGLIHRDIKPANIWLEAPDSRVKILDFGLAREQGETQLTQAGAIVGSPAFMAPEQARRRHLVDSRCDLFSLGCVLYLMTTGELPFQGDDAVAVLLALASTTPRSPAERNPAIQEELSELVMRLLEKVPDDRPESAREVMEAIEAMEKRL